MSMQLLPVPVPFVPFLRRSDRPLAWYERAPLPALRPIVDSAWLAGVMVILILLNTVVLALDRYPIGADEEDLYEQINFVLTILFSFELLLKLLGEGTGMFWRDNFNRFDFAIVSFGIAEIVIADNFDTLWAAAGGEKGVWGRGGNEKSEEGAGGGNRG